MSLRMVTPASGVKQIQVSYICGGFDGPAVGMLTAGQVLDVIPGSALESAIGLSNLTSLTGTLLNNALTGSDGTATANACSGRPTARRMLRSDRRREPWRPGGTDPTTWGHAALSH